MKERAFNTAFFFILLLLSVLFIFPVFIVLLNSFKLKFSIATAPFVLPNSETFSGLENYITGINSTGFLSAIGWSLFITVFSVAVLIIFTSMTAWYIVRVKTAGTKILYLSLVFSMIVPFQMVMFTMSKIANTLHLDNPLGIVFIYLGFGAGLSVFMYSGFVKSVPIEIEEAAMIDGCGPLGTFFKIVFPVLRPITVTVAILQTMWVWNDYLLPYLTLGSKYKTLPVAIQLAMQGAYGAVDWGSFMAMLVIAIIPIIIFYLFGQKYIISGVIAGAVKG